MAVNCAAIPDALFESELFGYERGAFTALAYRTHAGKFERCHGGTLLFDEIGDMSLGTQAVAARAPGWGARVGDSTYRQVDVRIIAATNKDLQAEVEQGTFRQDLFFRVNVFPILLPPLRERREDIPLLAERCLQKHQRKINNRVTRISDAVLQQLCCYEYPGNVRELENCLRRAVLMCKGDVLRAEHVEFEGDQEEAAAPGSHGKLIAGLQERVAGLVSEILQRADKRARANLIDLVEAALVDRALRQCGYNQVRAARMLGISRNTLRHRMKKYLIQPPGEEA